MRSPNGTRQDDYYWLRDDSRSAPQVLEYLAQENAYTEAMLAPQAERESKLFEELTGRLQADDQSVPVLDKGYWYYRRHVPGREYPVYARRSGTMDAVEEILLDGNELAADREHFRIGDFAVSPDGRLLAYTQDVLGRRQYELRIKDLRTGMALADHVQNVEPELAWSADSSVVLYIEKDPVTLLSVRVHAHTVATDPATDRLVYEEADDSYFLGLGKSRSEQYLLVSCSSTQQCEWLYADAHDPELRFRAVLPREAGHEYQVEHLGADFIVRTNWLAPNFRIVRAPIATSAAKATWLDVVAHRKDVFVEGFEVSSLRLAVNERFDGLLRIALHDWSEDRSAAPTLIPGCEESACTMTLVPIPGIDSPTLRYQVTSLTLPPTTYDYDLARNDREWKKTESVLGGFDPACYRTLRTTARARDATPIPVSLAHHRDTPLDGTAPVYLTAYGAYGYSSDPEFHSSWLSLMNRGFVVAIAHVRGGQEMGRAWYDAGRLAQKKNTFTDFIDVTDMLVRSGYGARDRICAQGGSAGGLLVGAVANMAPERYRAIVAHVPFVDVVTTMLDETIPLTSNEFDQWGDPRNSQAYEYLLSYSPYDNVRAQDYPAMLVFTGLWDSQVQYWEPVKWVAKLRAHKTDRNRLLLSVDMSAGHGGKSGRFQRYRETAREFAFLLAELERW